MNIMSVKVHCGIYQIQKPSFCFTVGLIKNVTVQSKLGRNRMNRF